MRFFLMFFYRFVILFFLLSLPVFAELPKIPEGCLKDRLHCSRSFLVKKSIDGRERNVIEINLFAVVEKDEFSLNQVIDIFFDFDRWAEYASNDGNEHLKFDRSLHLGFIDEQGVSVQRQYINTLVKAPFPFHWVRFRGIGHHQSMKSVGENIASFSFNHITDGVFNIPDEAPLYGAEGYSYHSGEYHFQIKDNEIYIYLIAWIIPSIDSLLHLSAPYIENAYFSILKGMFFLR